MCACVFTTAHHSSPLLSAASVPEEVGVVVSGQNSITVSWMVPAAPITYVVYYQLCAQQNQNNMTVSSSAGELTISGLQHRDCYSIRIVALSEHLPSPIWGPKDIIVAGERV